MRSPIFSLLMLLAYGGQTGSALARAPAPRFVPPGEMADAPRGFVDMCARDTFLCWLGAGTGTPAPLSAGTIAEQGGLITAALLPASRRIIPAPAIFTAPAPGASFVPTMMRDRDALALIKTINSQVNRQFAQKTDYETSGTGEYWEPVSANAMRAGDCEDFAIEKRLRLTRAGIAPERMFYGIAFVRGFGLHTVLVIRLNDGDYVLDSLAPRVRPWGDSRYTWLRFQVPGQPTSWVRATGGRGERAPT